MKDKANVRDYAKKVVLVGIIKVYGILIIGCHEYLGTGPLTEYLLLLVKGIPYGFRILLQHQFIKERQVHGVVPDGIFHQEDALHARSKNVFRGIEAVFQQFDDGNDKVCGTVPAEYVVYC